jgi:hypothetical protein
MNLTEGISQQKDSWDVPRRNLEICRKSLNMYQPPSTTPDKVDNNYELRMKIK